MVNIEGEFLEEVKPAFKRQVKSLLQEASERVKEASDLIAEAAKLSSIVKDEDHFQLQAKKILLRKNSKFFTLLEEEAVEQDDSSESGVESSDESLNEIGDEPINLVSGTPINTRKRRGSKPGPKSKKVRRYGGRRKKVEFKGVTFVKGNAEGNQYRARVTINKVAYEIGFFATALEAAYEYDEFKYRKTGSLTGINFPDRIKARIKKKRAIG